MAIKYFLNYQIKVLVETSKIFNKCYVNLVNSLRQCYFLMFKNVMFFNSISLILILDKFSENIGNKKITLLVRTHTLCLCVLMNFAKF